MRESNPEIDRLVFHDPLLTRLLPTLVILIAPPAVAFPAYTRLTGDMFALARIPLNAGYVFSTVMATQTGNFARLPFALSRWALSFPVLGAKRRNGVVNVSKSRDWLAERTIRSNWSPVKVRFDLVGTPMTAGNPFCFDGGQHSFKSAIVYIKEMEYIVCR